MTRMWMVKPEIMCRQHLLGEHKEIHQLLGTLRKQYKIDGYTRHNCVEVSSIEHRHNALVVEMQKRGYNHKSPIPTQSHINDMSEYLNPDSRNFIINKNSSLRDILERCPECRKRLLEIDRT